MTARLRKPGAAATAAPGFRFAVEGPAAVRADATPVRDAPYLADPGLKLAIIASKIG